MRLAVFVFALTLIFSTTLAHAMPLLVVPRAVGALWSFGGKVVKVASSRTMLATVGTAGMIGYQPTVNYCKKNKEKCKDILGDVSEYFFEDDEEQLMQCTASGFTGSDAQSICNDWLANANKRSQGYVFADRVEAKFTSKKEGYCAVYGGTYKYTGNSGTTFRCQDLSDSEKERIKTEKEQIKKEQAQKVVQNLSDDDITYIINNYGDQIDVEKYCSENSCDELELSFAEEVKKNQDKYDIDKINKQNCTVKNNKIVSCKKAHKDQLEFDFEKETEEENTNIDTDIEQKEEDEEPTICDTSDLTKEACEFFDWVDDEPEPKEDKKVEIEDEEEKPLDDDVIDIDKTCPPPEEIHITMPWGYSTVIVFDYKPYCDFAKALNPYMVATGGLMAMYTVAGVRRF